MIMRVSAKILIQVKWQSKYFTILYMDRKIDRYLIKSNPFNATDLFLLALETSENLRFSDVFSGCKKRSVSWNGSKYLQKLSWINKFNPVIVIEYLSKKKFMSLYFQWFQNDVWFTLKDALEFMVIKTTKIWRRKSTFSAEKFECDFHNM